MSECMSPVTVNMDEFDEPSPLEKVFCSQVSVEDYEMETATETQKALQELMKVIDKNPELYLNVLQRRKQDQHEEAGMMSFLKVKVMSMFNGGVYPGSKMSEDEKETKIKQLKTGMQKAFDYSQESKGRRFSKRLADKHGRVAVNDENIPVAHVSPHKSCPPAPPPPPPLPCPSDISTPRQTPLSNLTRPPLRDRNSQAFSPLPSSVGKPRKSHISRALGSSISCNSTSSLSSLTSELNSSNPMKRLRATGINKSPGGTPSRRNKRHSRRGSATSISSYSYEEPLHIVLMNVLEQKFKNVRSPSPMGRFNNAMSPASAHSFNQVEFTP